MKTPFILSLLCLSSLSLAQQFSEIFINPPGTDNGFEFIELTGAGGASLSGLSILAIEGDSTGAGTVDAVFDLASNTLGSNGLFLWRDSATVLNPAPDANTNVFVQDFSPDLENGSNTYVLVSGNTAVAGQDLDSGNDGTLDSGAWGSVLDAVSLVENDGASNFAYADDLGGTVFGPNAGFNADILVRLQNGAWIGGDVAGSGSGPYDFDLTRFTYSDGTAWTEAGTATPGSLNAVPEPATMAALSLGLLAMSRRKKN